jgi:hypothetical protein
MITAESYPYRVFISYSRDDLDDAKRLVDRLRELNLEPVWDQGNPSGRPFLEEIKTQIAHSHLFIPLLTPKAGHSSWVNHEIGYAMGRNVPVLPLSLGHLPDGMVVGIQAETAENTDGLVQRLTRSRINLLVENAETMAVHEFADLAQTRTDAIISHYKAVEPFLSENGQPLRHRAAFGSFSIPSSAKNPDWRDRSDGQAGSYGQDRINKLSAERTYLERYALRFGCDLVLSPHLPHLSRTSIRARIRILRSFVEKMLEAHARLRVVFDESALGENILIVGDWFLAESITPKSEGYRHTTISCHGPTVFKQLEEFDTQFRGYTDILSAEEAIQRLEKRLDAA